MNKFKVAMQKTGKFLKRNIYYVLIIACIAAIGTMVAVTLTRDKPSNDVPAVVTPADDTPVVDPGTDTPDEPVDNPDNPGDVVVPVIEPIVFISPVENGTVGTGYSDTALVFSKTLSQWSTHMAVDYMAEEGTAVVAVADGVVANIQDDVLEGHIVTINHKDGLTTRYCSLNENIAVVVGQSVTQGTKIGEVSTSMLLESSDGAHVHFEAIKDGANVNPAEYFITNEK